MLRFLTFFFLLFTAYCSRAQWPLNEQRYSDSLNAIVQQQQDDSIRANACYLLTSYWAARDTARARQYLEQGRALSRNYRFLYAMSYAHEAFLYFNSDMDKSARLFMQADQLLQPIRDPRAWKARSKIWQNYAGIQQRKDNDSLYIYITLHKAIPLALQAADSAIAGSQYSGIGVAFMNTEQYDKAEAYFDLAIRYLKAGKAEPSVLVAVLNRAGENYTYLGKYPQAKKILDTVKVILEPYSGSELYSGYYLVEGKYLHDQGDYKGAVASFDKGIATAGGYNKEYRIQELQILKTESLIAGKEYKSACALLLRLSKDQVLMSLDENRRGIYDGLATSYAGLGQKAIAYEWQKRYSDLNDSLNKSQLKDEINRLEIKFRNAEAGRELTMLRAEKDKAAFSARNSKLLALLLGSLCLLLLLLAVFVGVLYRNHRKSLLLKLKETDRQKELEVASALIEGEERERSRVARELHDGLGGMLAGVKIKLSGATERVPAMDAVILQLDQSVSELRRIARNMMPESLLNFGLETALEDLCASLRSKETTIEFQAYGMEKNITVPVQVNIYRIVQEALANALRYAGASWIVVQCSQNEEELFITIEDNGSGFDVARAEQKPGMGLSNIRNRVAYLKGSLDINSVPGEGTTIHAVFRLEQLPA